MLNEWRKDRLTLGCLKVKEKKKKNSQLDMENFIFEQKFDEIDLVPTNASHVDPKSRQQSLNKAKMSRPSTSKNKKNIQKIQLCHRNCETVLGRKGELKSYRKVPKKKQSSK